MRRAGTRDEFSRDFVRRTGFGHGSAAAPAIVGGLPCASALTSILSTWPIDTQPVSCPAVEEDATQIGFLPSAQHMEARVETAVGMYADELRRLACLS